MEQSSTARSEQPAAPAAGMVYCRTSQGVEIQATLLRINRFGAVFQAYNPVNVFRTSEVLEDFRIVVNERKIYAGKAVVRNLVGTGFTEVCEVTLEDAWFDVDFFSPEQRAVKLREEFQRFMNASQKTFHMSSEFKVAVADLQMLLLDLRTWMEQIELGVRSQPTGRRAEVEHDALQELQQVVLPVLAAVFEHFEDETRKVDPELQPVHSVYVKRQLHSVVLCAPFMYRTFAKPLGYAGDYEMVDMMVRDPYEGGSLFAKMLNAFFLLTPPVVAHRNRIKYLKQILKQECLRGERQGRPVRILNLGCGPAREIQEFLTEEAICDHAQFTLWDFNNETIEHVRTVLEALKNRFGRRTQLQFQKKSVHQVLKEGGKPVVTSTTNGHGGDGKYDLVYCAGLFDYLTETVCQKLVEIFYNMTAPGGLVLVSNVEASNPARGWMEFVVDWHLRYRDSQQMTALAPKRAPSDACRIVTEPIGVNIFLEVRKPDHA